MPTIIETTAATLNRHQVAYNKDIKQKLYAGLEFMEDFTVRACDHTWSAPNADTGEIIQGYQSGFTPKGTVGFDAEENTLQMQKVDISWTADDLQKWFASWKVEHHEIGKPENAWTFPKYLYEKHIYPKILAEENKNALYGVYQAPVEGVPGLSINAVDGLIVKLQAGIAAGKVVEIATGSITSANAVDRIEAFCDGLPELYRNLPGKILCSHTVAKYYARDYRGQFGTGNGVAGNQNTGLQVDYSNKRVVGRHNLSGSQGLIFVPDNRPNIIYGTRLKHNVLPVLRWNSAEIRVLKGTAEWYRFHGYEYAHEVFINDQFSI